MVNSIRKFDRSRLAWMATALGAVSVVAATSPASAHHSFAMFDRSKQVTLTGTVREFQWTNPHVFVEVVVQGDKGSETWSVEGASPNMLFRQGWGIDTFKSGDQVTIVINPLRDGGHGGDFVFAKLPSGKTLGNLQAKLPG